MHINSGKIPNRKRYGRVCWRWSNGATLNHASEPWRDRMSAMRVSELIKGFGPFTNPLNGGHTMDKAYEEYFESLAEGEEALSFAEFVEALS